MSLNNLIISTIENSVKSIFKLDSIVNELIIQFNDNCPTKERLTEIIIIKNTLSDTITQIDNRLNTLQSTATTTQGFIDGLNGIVQTIKAIPAPTAAPPGIGIPINIITILSDTLDTVGNILSSTNASLSAISPAISSINNKLQSTQSLLSQLDNLILGCLDENERQNYIVTQPLSSISNINNILDDQLQPNSNSPLGYKGYILTTEYDSSNTFSFPRRRIKASLATNPNNFILGPYSYSSSTQVLIDEIKFKIDQIVFNS
jgi:hypothetical protein